MQSFNFRFWGAICAIFFLLSGCDQDTAGPGKAGKKAVKAHLVEVVTVRDELVRHETVRTGTLTARRVVRIFNQEEGRIETIGAFEGDQVKQDQALVTLDRRILKAELDKAVAARKEAESNFTRVRNLWEKKIATQEKWIEAETTLQVAKAEETLIRTRLGYTEIIAPFDGVISERKAEPGDIAPRHTHLMTLIDPKTLYTRVGVSELMLPHLKMGGGVGVRIDALGDQVWSGRIERIHPTVDPRTRQGIVEVALDPVPPGAAAGQLCRVSLGTPESMRRLLPFAALRHDNKGEYVYVVVDGKAEKRWIRTGLRLGDKVEALEGLSDGELLVIRGFLDLVPGKPVKAVDHRPAAS
ncbi:MAG: efflux RND transporter periplasmic adaptor subunit [Rhodospirillales bacterium]|nr:efflux RND transporter periplasmic adaptor subunit [Rhodospirillales bacterium]MCW8862365.1 efflux RND transporter periplasmic adaptor subunit [Rhodospirillales bacterium]MCW8951377.1 efflux RND transporter periplasmic adaptor subunit [Rhodospirillales bacterium]MCW8971527.1 efflux RND transporter periplasmic adaptor subunit [Rhodospirillales bacterium]MCW9002239.1 efflux RND transporter periplasmic adaptor subunit [Rhodospirillales bacterium]